MARKEYADIVDRIDKILSGNGNMTQKTKDDLILLSIRGLLTLIEGDGGIMDRLEFLEKFKPYLQFLVWILAAFGVALIGALVAGKIHIGIGPP